MSKRKATIAPEFIGSYYVDADNKIYQLDSCEGEPSAIFVGSDGIKINKPISEFANLVRLKPVKELPKPVTPRKPRADKGIPRKKVESVEDKKEAQNGKSSIG